MNKETKDLLEEALRDGIITKADLEQAKRNPLAAEAICIEIRSYSKVATAASDVVRAKRQEEIQKAEEENRIAVLRAASKMGVSVQVYEQIMLKQAESRGGLDTELERAERLAQIEIEKQKVIKDNDANRDIKSTVLAVLIHTVKQYYDLKAQGDKGPTIQRVKKELDQLEETWARFLKQ